jgi:cytochrome c2
MSRHFLSGLLVLVQVSAWAADCNPAQGQQTFANKCGICHVAVKDAAPTVGPNLHGVVGRPQGRSAGFPYSEALASANGTWDEDRLNEFLKSPQTALPGNAMPFQGLKSDGERRQLICFLQTLK